MKFLSYLAVLGLCAGTVSADDSCCKSIKKELKKIAKRQKPDCCETTPICQNVINRNGGTLLLNKSGTYALTEDVVGTLIVVADSVCIDLCCHTLSAGGRASAIVANGHEGLDVYNGRIINTTDAAILVQDYDSVELYDLTMSGNVFDSIREQNSVDLRVHNVNFVNDNEGERALYFNSCDNIVVKNCNASGFLSTIGAIIQFDTCNAGSLENIDVTSNTKTSAADVDEFSAGTALVAVTESTGVDFVHVKVNNNTFDNSVPVADQNNHWRTAEAIAFFSSNNCSLHQCETSNNTDVAGNVATTDTEDYMLLFIFCDSCIVTEHQSNTNSCTQPILYFVAIGCLDSANNRFEGCQANSNLVSELFVLPGSESGMVPMWVAEYFDFALSNGNVLRNCQANFNTVTLGGAGRTDFDSAAYNEAILVGGTDSVVDHCQANNNTMGDNQPFTAALGIASIGTNTKILNSTADNNTGGGESFGINLFFSNLGSHGRNPLISNCSASSNGNWGIQVGFDGDLTETILDVVIEDCVCNKNGGQSGPAAGIIVVPVQPGATNIFIKGCQVYDTTSSDGDATGISVTNARNVVIEDCEVFTTTADGLGHGILFDTVTDSKIIRTQVHENQNSGVEIIGDNSNIAIIECIAMSNNIGFDFAIGSTASCSLVQDSRAIDNSVAGFAYPIGPLTVTFIGNESQCNGETICANYSNLNGTINLQELSWFDGSITPVNPVGPGAAAPGARFTNLIAVPTFTSIAGCIAPPP